MGITTEMPLSPRTALLNSLLLTLSAQFVVTDGGKMCVYVGSYVMAYAELSAGHDHSVGRMPN